MQQQETVQEIRNRILLRLGFTSDLDTDVKKQLDELIRMAQFKVQDDLDQVNQIFDAKLDLAKGQEDYSYPTTDVDGFTIFVGPQNVLNVALWDPQAERFIPMHRTKIYFPPRPDVDEMTAEAFERELDRPRCYEPLRKFRVNPIPDDEYVVIMRVTSDPDILKGDNYELNQSLVDAEAITLYACFLRREYERDTRGMDSFLRRYVDRVESLQGDEAPNIVVRPGKDAQIDELMLRRLRFGTEPFIESH